MAPVRVTDPFTEVEDDAGTQGNAPGTVSPTPPPPAGPAGSVPLAARLALVAGGAADKLAGRAATLTADGQMVCTVTVEGWGPVEVPTEALRLFVELLEDLSEGRAVAVAPYDLAVGTEAAADLLGVSRTWVTRLVDEDRLPGSRTGTKRRVLLGDLVAYGRRDNAARRKAQSWEFLDDDD